MTKRIVTGIVLVAALIFVWHFYLTSEVRRIAQEAGTKSAGEGEVSLSLNPITNVVVIKLIMPSPEVDETNPWATAGYKLGTSLGAGLLKVMEPVAERELNIKARKNFDFYAILVPYRLRITLEKPDDEALARIRGRREEKRQAEEQRKREAVRAYIKDGLALQDVHVAPGEHFGRTEMGVFGTIVNGGSKTLREVRVRIYFLGADGRRIGEKEYSPILVTKFGLGNNTPLRPGYRKDFGYSVKDHAPSGWADRVEAEIVEIEFLEKEG